MAWEAMYLLAPVLLVLLVSGSREQEPALVLLQKLEGENISLTCPYWGRKDSYMVKIWCKKTSENSRNLLVTSPRSWAKKSRYSIQDERRFSYFNITMTGLRTADSGFYDCGIYDSSQSVVYICRSFRLIVSPGEFFPFSYNSLYPSVESEATLTYSGIYDAGNPTQLRTRP
uniref:Ig-like domain-containing protein n=1 Tax=Loxodonta africana TaxID=9785 RepID=G3UMN8_LOXAF